VGFLKVSRAAQRATHNADAAPRVASHWW